MVLRLRTEDSVEQVAAGEWLLPGYRVLSLMRRGGRLDTYDVHSEDRDCRCVVKVVRPDRSDEDAPRAALVQEGELLHGMSHPHLVRVYEVFSGPRPAVVMETLTGATLAALIEDSTLAPLDVALLGRQLTSALGYLHRRGWVHLDVKPSNIVVQGGRAILIDLSLATRPGNGRPNAGTYGYLGPEQVTGVDLSAASDVFGLGVTLGEALTGELAYGEESRWKTGIAPRRPARVFTRGLRSAPEQLHDIVKACIEPDPARRPGIADVSGKLEAFLREATRQ